MKKVTMYGDGLFCMVTVLTHLSHPQYCVELATGAPCGDSPEKVVTTGDLMACASRSSNPELASGADPGSPTHSVGRTLTDVRYPLMRDISDYDRQGKIGQGTFGDVFKAKCRRTERTVALKRIRMEKEKEGFPITALREVKILRLLKNENVVELLDISSSKACDLNNYRSSFYLVFEFCEHDLAGLLSNPRVQFEDGEMKMIMHQLLNGLFWVHRAKVLHRDMKASNILITKDGVLKIADFGLAREFEHLGTKDNPNRFTNRVCTLWFRPPELLLGDRNYSPAVDVWGAGCIMCQLWTRRPILQGSNEQHQLQLISSLCGSITSEVYPGVESLEFYKTLDLPKKIRRDIRGRLGPYIRDPLAIALIDKMLILNPTSRIDTDSALNQDYFGSDPLPKSLADKMMTLTHSSFELTAAKMHHHGAGNRGPSHTWTFQDRVF